MLGSNVEGAIQMIDEVLDGLNYLNVDSVANHIIYSRDSFGCSDGGHSHSIHPYECPDHTVTISNVSRMRPIKSKFDSFITTVRLIDKNIYVRNTEMHNSIGSPYTELYRLQGAINELVSYSRSCTYMGEMVAAVAEANRLLTRTLVLAVDAKYALQRYADYTERGYNYVQKQNPDTTR